MTFHSVKNPKGGLGEQISLAIIDNNQGHLRLKISLGADAAACIGVDHNDRVELQFGRGEHGGQFRILEGTDYRLSRLSKESKALSFFCGLRHLPSYMTAESTGTRRVDCVFDDGILTVALPPEFIRDGGID